MPKTHTYHLTANGLRICVLFLKLFQRIYAPLTSGIFQRVGDDAHLPDPRRSTPDRLYAAVDHALDQLLDRLGLTFAA